MLKKIIAVAGPTASGKTALAVEIAKQVSGEVVSCDSMQIYKKMNIGTAKPSAEEMQGVVHHMIDIVEPDMRFSVADFVKIARQTIDDILSRGKVPILAGGTGLYMDSVINNIDFSEVELDAGFREELNKIAQNDGAEALYAILKGKDPQAAEKIHPNNIRRVIRAIEICNATGKTFTQVNNENLKTPVYEALVIGIETERQTLYNRIDKRVDRMMEDGLLDEVKDLYTLGIDKNSTAMQAIGYKELFEYIENRTELLQAIEKIKQESRRYAKRQLTWFRRNKDIIWVNLEEENAKEKVFDMCVGFIKKK